MPDSFGINEDSAVLLAVKTLKTVGLEAIGSIRRNRRTTSLYGLRST